MHQWIGVVSCMLACAPDDEVPAPRIEGIATETPTSLWPLATDGARLYGTIPDGSDVLVTAWDLDGAALWSAPTQPGARSGPGSLAVGVDGQVLWGNGIYDTSAFVPELMAFSPDGSELWRRPSVGDPTRDGIWGLAAHPSQPLLAVGADALVGVDEIAADGMQRWALPWPNADCNFPRGLVLAEDGGVVAVGSSRPSAGCRHAWIVRHEPSGRRRWYVERRGEGDDVARAYGIAADGDRFVVVGGDVAQLGADDAALLGHGWIEVVDGEGDRVWRRPMQLANATMVTGVAVDADGYVVLGMTSALEARVLPTTFQCFVQRFDREGDLVWSTLVSEPSGMTAPGVVVSTDRGIYFTCVPAGYVTENIDLFRIDEDDLQ